MAPRGRGDNKCPVYDNPCCEQTGRRVFNWFMQTAVYPTHPCKPASWPARPAAPGPSLAPVASHTGDWHYHGLPKAGRLATSLAVVVSACLHLALFWSGYSRPAPRAVVLVKDTPIIQLEMPPLEEEEEEPVEELDSLDDAPTVDVPRLADLPTTVALTDFVQPLQTNVPLENSIDASKLTHIPTNITPAGHRPGGMKNLFDISQLDRKPDPIAQPAPQFPHALRNTVEHAEVVVEFIVDTKGATRDVRAISSTHAGFEVAAVEGVSRWRFRPGMKDGRKVNTRTIVPIRFTIMDGL